MACADGMTGCEFIGKSDLSGLSNTNLYKSCFKSQLGFGMGWGVWAEGVVGGMGGWVGGWGDVGGDGEDGGDGGGS